MRKLFAAAFIAVFAIGAAGAASACPFGTMKTTDKEEKSISS